MLKSKKVDVKGTKHSRKLSSEEKDPLPGSLEDLTRQLACAVCRLKQNYGAGLSKYLWKHEKELDTIRVGLRALTERSPALTVITQETQTNIPRERDMNNILQEDVTDEELISLTRMK